MTTPKIPVPSIPTKDILSALNWRYATKVFNAEKKLSEAQWSSLQQALALSPSSYGLQPWRFINVADAALRSELKKASWNQTQITQASHLVVFASRTKVDVNDITQFIELTSKVRGLPSSTFEQYKQMMISDLVNGPRAAWVSEWAARQAYIALGNLLTAAATMGIDACPMEGFDPAAYDKLLKLEGTGYHSVVICTLGFRSDEDTYANQPKVRYDLKDLFINR